MGNEPVTESQECAFYWKGSLCILYYCQKYFIAFKNYYLAVLLLLKCSCIYRNISLKPVTLIFSSLTLLMILLYHKIKTVWV